MDLALGVFARFKARSTVKSRSSAERSVGGRGRRTMSEFGRVALVLERRYPLLALTGRCQWVVTVVTVVSWSG